MAQKKPPPAPAALAARGRKAWRLITAQYELRLDEVILLEEACRTLDDVERLRVALVGADLLVLGSAGQYRAHPLLTELRQSRALLAQHFRQLGFPDLDAAGTVPKPKSAAHQQAARTRWAGHTTRAAQAAARESGGA